MGGIRHKKSAIQFFANVVVPTFHVHTKYLQCTYIVPTMYLQCNYHVPTMYIDVEKSQ